MENNLLIYYFSGTGNARNVAQWFAGAAADKGVPAETADIAKIDRKKVEPPVPGSLIGFVSPTHGFNYPPAMMYFIFRFPGTRRTRDEGRRTKDEGRRTKEEGRRTRDEGRRTRDEGRRTNQHPASSFRYPASGNKVFLMNTRAGMKLSKWFLPGLSGITLWLAAIVMLLKGYRIAGLRSIDLPSNWISFHPGLKEKVVKSIYDHCKRITQTFANKILDGKTAYPAFRDIIQDILITPLSIGYFFVGRFILAKSFYASDKCDKCDLCINNCPVKAIITVDNRPFWSYRCESCMRCMNDCPKRAIETGHGYIAGIVCLLSMVIMVWFWRWVATFVTIPASNVWVQAARTIVQWGVIFIVMVLSYRFYHYLLKVPGIRQFFQFTSLTRYKFWRRYKPSRKMVSNLP